MKLGQLKIRKQSWKYEFETESLIFGDFWMEGCINRGTKAIMIRYRKQPWNLEIFTVDSKHKKGNDYSKGEISI